MASFQKSATLEGLQIIGLGGLSEDLVQNMLQLEGSLKGALIAGITSNVLQSSAESVKERQ